MKKIILVIKWIAFTLSLTSWAFVYSFAPGFDWADISHGWLEGAIIFTTLISLIICYGLINNKNPFKGKNKKSKIKFFIKSVFIDYHAWGAVQQTTVFGIYFLFRAFIPEYAIIVTALIFGFVFHFSNYLLTFATIGMGFLYIYHFEFLANQNILIPFIGHGLLATTLKFFVPEIVVTDWVTWKSYWTKQRKIYEARSK